MKIGRSPGLRGPAGAHRRGVGSHAKL